MTAFNEDAALSMTNQEGLDVVFTVNEYDEDGGLIGPYDFTSSTLSGSVKKTRSLTADTLATLVFVKDDAVNGVIRVTMTEAEAEDILPSPTSGAHPYWYWDFNVKEPGDERKNFWIAPFVVEAGVTPE